MILPLFLHLSFMFIIILSIQQSPWSLPFNEKNFDRNDPLSLLNKLSSMIKESKEGSKSFMQDRRSFLCFIVSRFRCPENWQRFGSSCYYLSNLTSTSFEANYTCNFLHFENSKLIYIRRSVELFYVAHVMTMNHINTSLIEIDPSYLKGKQTD
jgi:hypothetical protein